MLYFFVGWAQQMLRLLLFLSCIMIQCKNISTQAIQTLLTVNCIVFTFAQTNKQAHITKLLNGSTIVSL